MRVIQHPGSMRGMCCLVSCSVSAVSAYLSTEPGIRCAMLARVLVTCAEALHVPCGSTDRRGVLWGTSGSEATALERGGVNAVV